LGVPQDSLGLLNPALVRGTTPPSHTLVFPTFTQSRYMAYQAIVNGARGLMFFGGSLGDSQHRKFFFEVGRFF